MIPFLLLIHLLFGLTLLTLGLYGRRISTHPHCRVCKFDLHGLPSAVVCPECGRDLHAPKAIRKGLRKRSRLAIVTGVSLIITSIALGAIFGGAFRTSRMTLMPTWAILIEAKSDTRSSDQALKELHDRITAGKLTPAAIAPIIAHALDRQADQSMAWLHGWGDIIESGHAMGLVSDSQWTSYARHCITIHVSPRRTIRVGDPYTVLLSPSFRCATRSILRLEPTWWIYWNSPDACPVFVEWARWIPSGIQFPMDIRPTSVVSVRDIPGISRPTSVGTSTLQFAVGCIVTDTTTLAFDPILLPPADETQRAAEKLIAPADLAEPLPPNTVAAWKTIVNEPITVVSRDTEVIELRRDPALAAGMRDAAQMLRLRKNTQYDSCSSRPGAPMHHIEAVLGEVPLPAVFKIIVEDPEHGRLDLGTIRCMRFGEMSICHPGRYPPHLSRERVTVRLVPDVDSAMQVRAITQLWGDEIVLDDVPLYDVATHFGGLSTFPATAKAR